MLTSCSSNFKVKVALCSVLQAPSSRSRVVLVVLPVVHASACGYRCFIFHPLLLTWCVLQEAVNGAQVWRTIKAMMSVMHPVVTGLRFLESDSPLLSTVVPTMLTISDALDTLTSSPDAAAWKFAIRRIAKQYLDKYITPVQVQL